MGRTFASQSIWPDERIDRLRAIHARGYSCSQIALQLGITRNAVIGKLNRLGIGFDRPAPPSIIRQIQTLQVKKQPASIGGGKVLIGKRLARPPVPPAEVPTPPQAAPLVALEDLRPHHCRWPIGDLQRAGFGFCGQPKFIGKPYCAHHCALAYAEPKRRAA